MSRVSARRETMEMLDAAVPVTRSVVSLPCRIHFAKAVVMKLGGTFCGPQGLANLTTDTSHILAKDASGLLLAHEGKAHFFPWANIAWIEHL
jgi:hypothetical protein